MQTAAARSARLIALGTSLWLLAAPKLYGEAPAASAPLPPVVAQAEKVFFSAFGEGTPGPADAIGILTGAYTAAPSHGRTNLLLGLAHLWQASENQSSRGASITSCCPSAFSREPRSSCPTTDAFRAGSSPCGSRSPESSATTPRRDR